ncbi:hypothetical protein K2X33_12980 [bacterium]|nr:hypothetical protein [bacterium]
MRLWTAALFAGLSSAVFGTWAGTFTGSSIQGIEHAIYEARFPFIGFRSQLSLTETYPISQAYSVTNESAAGQHLVWAVSLEVSQKPQRVVINDFTRCTTAGMMTPGNALNAAGDELQTLGRKEFPVDKTFEVGRFHFAGPDTYDQITLQHWWTCAEILPQKTTPTGKYCGEEEITPSDALLSAYDSVKDHFQDFPQNKTVAVVPRYFVRRSAPAVLHWTACID